MKKLIFKINLLIFVIIFVLLLIEILLIIFTTAPTNVVVYSEAKPELSQQSSFIQNLSLYEHPEEGGLYIETKHGRRLNPNMNVVIKNHSLSNRTINIRTNSLGFRNQELSRIKERKRILFLGDSITFGDWLEEEKIFVSLIEKKLHKKGLNDYKTINAGIGSIGAENVLNILKETGRIVQPDIIILNFYLNDFEQSAGIQMLNPPNIFRNSCNKIFTKKLLKFFIMFVIVLLVYEIIILIPKINQFELIDFSDYPEINYDFNYEVIDERPNIYYLILDEYGRKDTLLNYYNFDNSEFINNLRKNGFYVVDKATSNYTHTVISIPTTFNMNYILIF